MKYYHADAFSKGPFTGNGLSVFIADAFPKKETMQAIACELKQYETIFLVQTAEDRFSARIFTIEEELPFAGHPLLGAAAVLHRECHRDDHTCIFIFDLSRNSVSVSSTAKAHENEFACSMNQGRIHFIGSIKKEEQIRFLDPIGLAEENLADLSMDILSAGLPYLYIPLRNGLEKIKYHTNDYEKMLLSVGAKFAYPFDVKSLEGRSFDNYGISEDVATGSAAGPLGEYLIRHGLCNTNTNITIHQGRFLNRPSEIIVRKDSCSDEITVSGNVTLLAFGYFFQ